MLREAYIPYSSLEKKQDRAFRVKRKDNCFGRFPKKTKYVVLFINPDRSVNLKATYKSKVAKAIMKKNGTYVPWYCFGAKKGSPQYYLFMLISIPFRLVGAVLGLVWWIISRILVTVTGGLLDFVDFAGDISSFSDMASLAGVEGLGDIADTVSQGMDQVNDLAGGIADQVGDVASGVTDQLGDSMGSLGEQASAGVGSLGGNLQGPAAGLRDQAAASIRERIQSAPGDISASVSEKIQSAPDELRHKAIEKVQDKMEDAQIDMEDRMLGLKDDERAEVDETVRRQMRKNKGGRQTPPPTPRQ